MKKFVTLIAATVVSASIGFGAAQASAATPAPAAKTVAAAIHFGYRTGAVQQAGFRIYIGTYRYSYWHRRCYVVGYRRFYSYIYHRWFVQPIYRCFYRYY